MRHVPAVEATTLLTIEPVLNPLWAWLIHGESPGLGPFGRRRADSFRYAGKYLAHHQKLGLEHFPFVIIPDRTKLNRTINNSVFRGRQAPFGRAQTRAVDRGFRYTPRLAETNELLPAVLELGRKLNSAEACAIWQRDEREEVWRLTSSLGLSESYQRGAVIPLEAAIPLDNEPVCIADTRKSEHLPERRPFLEAEGIRGILVMPLKIAGELPATLVFYYRRPHRFSATELRVAGALANLAASAMHTAELYQNQEQTRIAAERARRRAAFLAEASSVLSSSLNHETTLATVAYLAIPHIADWCVVHTVEAGRLPKADRRSLGSREGGLGPAGDRAVPGAVERKHRPAAVARTGKPELRPVITDRMLRAVARDEDHLELLRSIGFSSFMCVPLKARGKVLGTMSFVSADPENRYGPEELALAEDLAQRAAMAIDNALLYASVQRERAALETALLACRRTNSA